MKDSSARSTPLLLKGKLFSLFKYLCPANYFDFAYSFVEYVTSLIGIDNNNLFIVKLPASSGGVLGDHPNIKRNCKGAAGIIAAVMSFLKRNPMVLGYIPYVIIQPQFPFTSEAKVSFYY